MKKLLLYILLLSLSLSVNLYSQNPGAPGSYSLFHTQEARTFNPGRLHAYANYNFFTKLGEFIGSTPADFDAVNYWLIASNIAFTYGIVDHLDMSVGVRIYQDTHHENEFNLPDDIFISLKTGSYFFGRERFALGLLASTRIGVGEVHNYPFAEYASGAVEYGLKAALSFYTDPYFPERSINAHFNIGWWNHNEEGQKIQVIRDADREATGSSSHLSMALATVVPLGEFELRGELSGILFLNNPDKFIYSSEDFAYFTPSIRYKPYDWVSMDLGIDLRISPSDRQNTEGVLDISEQLDLPKNYPSWRLQAGLQFKILPLGRKTFYRGEGVNPDVLRMLKYFDELEAEKAKAADLDDEIKDLRKVRESADRELEDLKRQLEEEG